MVLRYKQVLKYESTIIFNQIQMRENMVILSLNASMGN